MVGNKFKGVTEFWVGRVFFFFFLGGVALESGGWRNFYLPACPNLSTSLHASAHLSLSHHTEIDSPPLLISSQVTAARGKRHSKIERKTDNHCLPHCLLHGCLHSLPFVVQQHSVPGAILACQWSCHLQIVMIHYNRNYTVHGGVSDY